MISSDQKVVRKLDDNKIKLVRSPDKESNKMFSNEDERKLLIENENAREQIRIRKNYSNRTWVLVISWLVFSALVTLIQQCLKPFGVGLDATEFMAVVVTNGGVIFAMYKEIGKYAFDGKQ